MDRMGDKVVQLQAREGIRRPQPKAGPATTPVDRARRDRVELSDEARRELGDGPLGKEGDKSSGPIGKGNLDAFEEALETARQRQDVTRALESGDEVSYTNSQGDEVSVAVTESGSTEDGFTTYTVEVDGQPVQVQVEDGVDPIAAISGTVDAWSHYPPELRGDLHTVRVHAGSDPHHDPNDPDSVDAAARAADGTISFYHGTQFLNQDVFDHEYGHVIGDATEDRQASPWERFQEWVNGHEVDEDPAEQFIPEGYSDAIEADGNEVSDYGEGNPTEDWGDFWREYVQAYREGPEALARLEAEHPERFQIAEEVYEAAA